MQWKFSTLISEWKVSLVAYSMLLKNCVPLKGWLEVLFDLSWRHPPGKDKDNVLGSPHWACPVILSPEGKVQLDLSVLATVLENVIIYGTKKKCEQLWYAHHCVFWLIACANSPYVLLTWSPLILFKKVGWVFVVSLALIYKIDWLSWLKDSTEELDSIIKNMKIIKQNTEKEHTQILRHDKKLNIWIIGIRKKNSRSTAKNRSTTRS